MKFFLNHEYRCMACGKIYILSGSEDIYSSPPLLTKSQETINREIDAQKKSGKTKKEIVVIREDARILHCEYDEKHSKCWGILRYIKSSPKPIEMQKCINETLKYLGTSDQPTLNNCQVAIERMRDALTKQMITLPFLDDDFWMEISQAQKERIRLAASFQLQNSKQALDQAIRQGRGKDGRTLAVAWNKSKKEYVTGSSGGLGNLTWRRDENGKVNISESDEKLDPLIDALNEVELKPALNREVWVCAEVDAAVKALKKGWHLNEITFACAEAPEHDWRFIDACAHCRQWCE